MMNRVIMMLIDETIVQKKSFENVVEELLETYSDSPQSVRNQVVDEVCEAYVRFYGKKPHPYQLTLLANLVLLDDIRNPSAYKVQHEEYPFHSDTQSRRRRKKEFVTEGDTLEHMNFKRKTNLSTAPQKDVI